MASVPLWLGQSIAVHHRETETQRISDSSSPMQNSEEPLIILGGVMLAVSFRILTVWLYNNTGKSVFAAIVFHAVNNTGRSIFPGSRSTFELWDGTIGYGLIAITAVIVVFLWGPTTLARFRYARSASSR